MTWGFDSFKQSKEHLESMGYHFTEEHVGPSEILDMAGKVMPEMAVDHPHEHEMYVQYGQRFADELQAQLPDMDGLDIGRVICALLPLLVPLQLGLEADERAVGLSGTVVQYAAVILAGKMPDESR